MFSIIMVVANTMAMTFRERTLEVAVLKTLGFRSKMLLGILVTEGLVIALSGWLLGSGLAYALWSNLDLGRAGVGFFGHLKVLPSTLGVASRRSRARGSEFFVHRGASHQITDRPGLSADLGRAIWNSR
jgi:hypothetical protein